MKRTMLLYQVGSRSDPEPILEEIPIDREKERDRQTETEREWVYLARAKACFSMSAALYLLTIIVKQTKNSFQKKNRLMSFRLNTV